MDGFTFSYFSLHVSMIRTDYKTYCDQMNKIPLDTKYSVKLYELRNMVFNRSCFLHVLSKNYRL